MLDWPTKTKTLIGWSCPWSVVHHSEQTKKKLQIPNCLQILVITFMCPRRIEWMDGFRTKFRIRPYYHLLTTTVDVPWPSGFEFTAPMFLEIECMQQTEPCQPKVGISDKPMSKEYHRFPSVLAGYLALEGCFHVAYNPQSSSGAIFRSPNLIG